MKFFDLHGDIRFTQNRLPHWQQSGAVYFVTFRLADALPQDLLEQWQEERNVWLKWHPPPWSAEVEREYHRRFSRRIEEWLDGGHGGCALRRKECAPEIATAIRHFDGTRVNIISFVIMPNHAHVLFAPMRDWPLEKMVHSWKRQSAVRINRLIGSNGVLWQRDYFDRLVRNEQHFINCVRYIRSNPEKARLRSGDYVLYESDIARAVGEAIYTAFPIRPAHPQVAVRVPVARQLAGATPVVCEMVAPKVCRP
jgi:putative transposase